MALLNLCGAEMSIIEHTYEWTPWNVVCVSDLRVCLCVRVCVCVCWINK